MRRHLAASVMAWAAVLFGACLPGQAPAQALHYRVIHGESLYAIGDKLLGTAEGWKLLQRWNQLTNPHSLQPGQRLAVLLPALRDRVAISTVLSTRGEPMVGLAARSGQRSAAAGARGGCMGATLAAGQQLREGVCIQTGAHDLVAIALPDGSRLQVFPDTRMHLLRAMHWSGGKHRWVEVQLDYGRVESHTQPGRGVYRIGTPWGLAAVRGTAFGVEVRAQRMLVDVAEGVVEVSAEGAHAQDLLSSGQGAAVARGQGVRVLALPAAPILEAEQAGPVVVRRDTRGVPALPFGAMNAQGTVVAERAARAQGEGPAYGYVIAQDDNAGAVVASGSVTRPEVPLQTLAEGAYAVRLRVLGAQGLPGQPALRRVQLLEVPDPPLLQLPHEGAVVAFGRVALQCRAALGGRSAETFEFQLARDAQFLQLVQVAQREACALDTPVQDGTYYWRVRAVGAPLGSQVRAGAFSETGFFHAQLDGSGAHVQAGEGGAADSVSAAGQPVRQGGAASFDAR